MLLQPAGTPNFPAEIPVSAVHLGDKK